MRSTKTRPELQAWGVVLVLAAACVLCSLSVIAIQPGPLSETLSVFWADKVLFLLNGFPVCVVLLLCWCAAGNVFTAAGLGGLIVNLMSYVNLVKTDCRNDPFVPDDIQLLREAVNGFLDSLERERRIVFVQRYWYMLGISEIAAERGMTEGAVKMSLKRTRDNLKIFLEKEGFTV